MKPGDRVIHKTSCCILDVLKIQGAKVSCAYIWVPQKEYQRTGILPGERKIFLKDELEETNGTTEARVQ